ncbi:MAG TPA: CDP-alcohol phosphatidyltransferase family protein [Candidatus Thermoplasmatota archaeon]|nr:CDP-alcohol phosphatidyltransferase family protein [Candidatus Thermoplasmatota archaeon]
MPGSDGPAKRGDAKTPTENAPSSGGIGGERWTRLPQLKVPRLPPLRVPRLPDMRTTSAGIRVRRIGHAVRGRIPRLPRIGSVLSAADLFTLTNGLAGFLAIAVLTKAVVLYEPPFFPGLASVFPGLAPSEDDRFLLAAILITLGGICDALDGIVARKFGGSNLGGDLDTLSDTITFVATPAFMVFTYYGEEHTYQALLAAGLVLIMGMLRLARFNANPVEGQTVTFQGLPTPWSAVTIALLILARIPWNFALPIVVILAFLNMSNVSYPKSRGRNVIFALLMAAAAVTTVVVILFFPENQPRVLRGSFTFVILAVALLPLFYSRGRRERRAARAGSAARREP